MIFKTFDIEEDNRRYREFLSSPQFRYATKAINHYETNDGGLTPAEVWHEVDELFAYLKGVDAEDHADMVVQLFLQERRRLKTLERDEETLTLEKEQMQRTSDPDPDPDQGQDQGDRNFYTQNFYTQYIPSHLLKQIA